MTVNKIGMELWKNLVALVGNGGWFAVVMALLLGGILWYCSRKGKHKGRYNSY